MGGDEFYDADLDCPYCEEGLVLWALRDFDEIIELKKKVKGCRKNIHNCPYCSNPIQIFSKDKLYGVYLTRNPPDDGVIRVEQGMFITE